MSALCVTDGVRPFQWPCSISIHLSPRSVTAGVRPFPLPMQHFYSYVSQVCHWWCPPFSAGRVAFLFICLPDLSLLVSALFYSFVSQICHCWRAFLFTCLPGLSLLVSALFRWPRNSSIMCFPGLSLQVSAFFRWPCIISVRLSPRSVAAGHVAFLFFCLPGLSLVCPCLLAMKHFYSFVSQVRHCWSMWHFY